MTTTATRTVDVRLARLFWDDHVARGLPGGFVLATGARTVLVRLTPAVYDELVSDAAHYAGIGMDEWEEGANVRASAARVLAALGKAGRP